MTLPELLEWFRDHADLPPRKIHQRGVWVDPDDHAGSVIGSPDWTAAWTKWLHAPPHATVVETYEDTCYHVGLRPGQTQCPSCTVYRPDGTVLYSTGVVKRTRVRYRWPMRLVLHRLWKTPDRPGRPNMGSVLWQLLVADFDMHRAATALAVKWPDMHQPITARAVFYLALRKAHRLYREDVEYQVNRRGGHKPKSDAQLDAEAEGRTADAIRPSHGVDGAV